MPGYCPAGMFVMRTRPFGPVPTRTFVPRMETNAAWMGTSPVSLTTPSIVPRTMGVSGAGPVPAGRNCARAIDGGDTASASRAVNNKIAREIRDMMSCAHDRIRIRRRSRRPGSTQPPASVSNIDCEPRRRELRRAVVLAVRSDHRPAERDAVEALGLWYWHHLGHKVLVRTGRDVDWDLIKLLVTPHVDPPITFHDKRIAFLIENRVEDGVGRRRGGERRCRQAAGVLSNHIEISDRAGLVACSELCLCAKQDQLFVADNRDRRRRRGPDAVAQRRLRAGRTSG